MIRKKYYLWILGCAMNYSDAERIASVFDTAGYQKVDTEDEADIAVVVACSVRQTAIDRIYGKVKPWNKRRRKTGFKTVLAGCVLPDDKKKLASSFDLIFDINEIERLADFIKDKSQITNDNQIRNSKLEIRNSGEYLSILPKYSSSFRAYVPIMTGCDNFCSYCAVPYTRGREKSRPSNDIVDEVKALVKKGYKEITLLGQNVNSYGLSQKAKGKNQKYNSKFIGLLEKIDKIPGDYRVYFYSNHPKDFSDELIATLPKLKHFPKYIHLPLQSGNNEILRKMNRRYTQKEYLELVARIRKSIPDVVLTTDVMVGFPGESEAEFADTMDVIRKAKFEMIFIGQYSPRAGTPSSKIKDDVSLSIKKKRDVAITNYLREYLVGFNQKFVGQAVRVLVDEEKGDKYFGRTEGYKVVEIKTDQPLGVGQFYDVEINEAKAWKLFG